MTYTLTDLFAGAGGSSTGAADVPGVEITMAANHWKLAIAVHNLNHPNTDHAAVDLHQEDPRFFPKTDILWASPECTKWSQANGSKPLPAIEEGLFEDPLADEAAQRSRLLMFDVLRFAEHHRYRIMLIENVVDIATQAKYRLAWHVWRQELTKLGYRFRVVSLNSMHAQAFGRPSPQSRDRIYIGCWLEGTPAPDFERILRPRAYCGRCDTMVEAQQAWKPGRTVGRYRQSYVYVHGSCGTAVEPGYLPAAVAIDWTIPGTRIGDGRLTEKTLTRIAAGIARYWGPLHIEASGNQYDAADPKHAQHGNPNAYYRAWSVQEYLRVLHTAETKALVVPVEGRDGKQAAPVDAALRTMTTRAETAFVSMLRGDHPQDYPTDQPADTFCASGNHHALITRHYGIRGGDPARHTTPADEELRTLTANGGNMSLITPYYGNSDSALPIDQPVGTLTTVDRYALVHRNNGDEHAAWATTPASEYLRTFTTTGHQALIQGPVRGQRPKITDADLEAARDLVPECLFRMFTPAEVAAGMSFPADYAWDVLDEKGRPPSNRNLVKMAGNAVTPPAARDLVTVVVDTLDGAA